MAPLLALQLVLLSALQSVWPKEPRLVTPLVMPLVMQSALQLVSPKELW
jgi:hypothetical protein